MKTTKLMLAGALVFAVACGDDHDHDHDHENEVITTVSLTFTPTGGTVQTFEFDDPDGDGGDAPTIDDIDLAAGDYTLSVTFSNKLEDPPEDITAEISDEGDEHQLFFTGTAVDGPATNNAGAAIGQAYSDMDMDGLPIGLSNDIVAVAGTGDLTLTLRHMPPVNDQAVKVDGLAGQVASGGLSSIGGSSDVSVTFSVTVQ